MTWQIIEQWARKRARLLAYTGSITFMTIWTVLRFFTQRTIFDLVGQQVLAQQLLHGGIAGAGIGITNYLPKLLFLYVPLHLLPGSPRIKLLLLTVIVNAATVLLLGLVLEKLLQKFSIKAGAFLWIGLVWLGAIAGSVFWVQFTNSRNLEVAGGVFLLYLGVCYLEHPSWRRLTAIGLFGAALFFADTLQLYMTAMPLILYGITLGVRSRTYRNISFLSAGLVAAYAGSKLLFSICVWLFSIHFVQNGTGASTPSVHSLIYGAANSLKALVHLYSGAADARKLRELCNLAFLATIVLACAYNIRYKLLPRRLLLLIGYVVVVNELLYVVSGQAQAAGTERYLIMTAPALVLLLGGMQASWKSLRKWGLATLGIVVAINGIFLTKALVSSSGHRYSQDSHLVSVAQYTANNPKALAYGSMDSAIPVSYLYGSGAAPLPLSCSGSHLAKNDTFYSRTAYKRRERSTHTAVAIILDGSTITNTPSVCDQAAIISQLGKPARVATTNDGSVVLLYTPRVSSKLQY